MGQPGVLASAWRYRRLVVLIVVLFGLAALLFTAIRPNRYLAEATIVLEDPETSLLLGTNSLVAGDRLVANQLEVVQSGLVALRAAEIASQQGFELTPGEIFAGSSFTTLRGTDVIGIGFSSDDPREAEVVANSIVEAYDQIQREQRLEANAAVESRLDEADIVLAEELASVDEQIDSLLAGRALGPKIDQVLNRIAGLQQQISETSNPETRESLLSLLDQEDRQLEILRAALEVETERSDVAALLANRTSIHERMAAVDSQRSNILLQAEIEGSGISFFSPAAVTTVSSGAGRIFTVLGGMFVGALVALGLAYSLGNWRRGFTDWTQPETLLSVPALAEIPQWETDASTLLPVRDAPRSLAAESFRFAAANLEVRLGKGKLKSVYFASAGVGDGKSTLIANIAAAAARTKNVLVIDADFGSQELSKLLLGDFKLQAGLTELAKGDVDVRSAVTRVRLSEGVGLDLLGRGVDPIIAPDFFGSGNLEETIGDVSTRYDMVLIDGPPLLQVAYASTLSRAASATVMVIQNGGSVRAGSELASRLRFLNANVIGYFYNRAPKRDIVDSNGGSMRDVLGDRGLVEPIKRPRSVGRR
ncbi:MAG TPA: AAA family ATPase [Acidimicrobiia bacterium]|nr:AAA family ATPase [Acidimicrobiia bacterium]